MTRHEWVSHPFGPVWDENSRILIVGTLPSPASRASAFYYGHPQNRFWPLVAALTKQPLPQTIQEKKQLLLDQGIALWDVFQQCQIRGAADISIRQAVAHPLQAWLENRAITAVFANGQAAGRQACQLVHSCPVYVLPSTSSANARYSLAALIQAWEGVRLALARARPPSSEKGAGFHV